MHTRSGYDPDSAMKVLSSSLLITTPDEAVNPKRKKYSSEGEQRQATTRREDLKMMNASCIQKLKRVGGKGVIHTARRNRREEHGMKLVIDAKAAIHYEWDELLDVLLMITRKSEWVVIGGDGSFRNRGCILWRCYPDLSGGRNHHR